MSKDMTAPCENGFINIRVGAIIMQNKKILMIGNERVDYLYSVGGRIKFGETAEQAVVREVFEETGVKMEVDRLAFIHENYFYGDAPYNNGKLVYEISYFFYMKVPKNFSPTNKSYTEDDRKEYIKWISPSDNSQKIYPAFFRTELTHPKKHVKHFLSDARKDQ